MAWKFDEIGGVIVPTQYSSLITDTSTSDFFGLRLARYLSTTIWMEERQSQLQTELQFFVSSLMKKIQHVSK